MIPIRACDDNSIPRDHGRDQATMLSCASNFGDRSACMLLERSACRFERQDRVLSCDEIWRFRKHSAIPLQDYSVAIARN